MTLIVDFDLDILKMHLHTKSVTLGQGFQKLMPEQYRQMRSNALPRRIRSDNKPWPG